MKYLCVIFIPPLYLLMRGKTGACVVNSIFYGVACLFLISFIGAMIAPFFWLIAVLHASFYFSKEVMAENAEMIATKMAEKMKASQVPPTIPPQ